MKSRAARLQPAVDRAHDHCEHELVRLAREQQQLAAAEQQLAELHRYRLEYATASGGESVSALLNRQRFIARIDQAIAQQERDLVRLRRQLADAEASWRTAHAREAALTSVVRQHHENERQAEERMEQFDVDDRMQHRRPPR